MEQHVEKWLKGNGLEGIGIKLIDEMEDWKMQ